MTNGISEQLSVATTIMTLAFDPFPRPFPTLFGIGLAADEGGVGNLSAQPLRTGVSGRPSR
jgi:hypothetical protein